MFQSYICRSDGKNMQMIRKLGPELRDTVCLHEVLASTAKLPQTRLHEQDT